MQRTLEKEKKDWRGAMSLSDGPIGILDLIREKARLFGTLIWERKVGLALTSKGLFRCCLLPSPVYFPYIFGPDSSLLFLSLFKLFPYLVLFACACFCVFFPLLRGLFLLPCSILVF